MAEIITVTVPELPFVPQVDGTEMIAVFKGDRLQRISQAALRGTKTFSGERDPPQQPSIIIDLQPLVGDRWRNTLTGDEWKITSLAPFTWTPDGNVRGAGSTVPGPPGPPGKTGSVGPMGPPGESGAEIRRTAAAYIPPRRLVADAGSGRARLLDPTDPTQAGLVLGFVAQEAFPGAELVILQGDLDGVSFDFGYGTAGPLYPADDGSLTRTPRRTGFSQVVGWTADGISAVVRLGPARPFFGLGGGTPSPTPDTAQLVLGIFGSAFAGPDGLAPGRFYLNDGLLERTPNGSPASGGTAAVEGALSALWDSLSSDPTTLAPGTLYLSGRALACTAPIPAASVGAVSPGFLADLGVFWDSRPAGSEGLGSKKFYRNGNALERTP